MTSHPDKMSPKCIFLEQTTLHVPCVSPALFPISFTQQAFVPHVEESLSIFVQPPRKCSPSSHLQTQPSLCNKSLNGNVHISASQLLKAANQSAHTSIIHFSRSSISYATVFSPCRFFLPKTQISNIFWLSPRTMLNTLIWLTPFCSADILCLKTIVTAVDCELSLYLALPVQSCSIKLKTFYTLQNIVDCSMDEQA